eukprot:COSAG02_NODE_2402_length_8943_cov_2.854138_11_plen_89_part_00
MPVSPCRAFLVALNDCLVGLYYGTFVLLDRFCFIVSTVVTQSHREVAASWQRASQHRSRCRYSRSLRHQNEIKHAGQRTHESNGKQSG